MRLKALPIAIFVLSAVGLAQDASRIFQLHYINDKREIAEFATLLSMISDVKPEMDDVQKTLSVRGDAGQVAIAEWLFIELDRQTHPDSISREFRVSNNADDVVRVFYFKNASTQQTFQEIVTSVRTITECRRMTTLTMPRTLAMRGTADQIAASEWLVGELDKPAEVAKTNTGVFKVMDTEKLGETDIRVFYLQYATTVLKFQEVATLIRTVEETRRLYMVNASKAIIVRATSDQVAAAAWLIQELGTPVTADRTSSAPYQQIPAYHDVETALRVFYLKNLPSIEAFQGEMMQIRSQTKMRRVFGYNASMAMAVRGTAEQIAMAEQILKDRQVAAK
jgi:hypothetical protein